MKRKICVVVTARASYSRVKSIMTAIKNRKDSELQVVTTCSANYEEFGNVAEIMEKDGFKIDEKIYSYVGAYSLACAPQTTGLTLMKLSEVFERLKPDIVITNGDRYETMATAVCAAYMNIMLAHIQGGDVTGNIDEKVRHAITKLADIHFATSETSYKRLLLLGEDPQKVFMFGCPAIDLVRDIYGLEKLDFNPFEKYKNFGNMNRMPDKYYVVMQHPTTTQPEKARQNFEQTLAAIKKLNMPTFIFFPNADASASELKSAIEDFYHDNPDLPIHFFYNMQPEDFIKFIYKSQCLIGNSSVGIRECAYLGIPVVNVGDRQANRERGCNVIDVDYNADAVYDAVKKWETLVRPEQSLIYGDGGAGKKIADTLASVEIGTQKKLTYKV